MKDREKLIEAMAREIAVNANANFDAEDFSQTTNGCDPDEDREHFRDTARAALSAIEAAGYVLVPREPTAAMRDAMSEAINREVLTRDDWGFDCDDVYAAAIDASPIGEKPGEKE